MTPTETPTASAGRRARVACKACNARRVKCDAADGQPCWHCRMRRIDCELIESKRGKYTRRSRRRPVPSEDQTPSRNTRSTQRASPAVSPENRIHTDFIPRQSSGTEGLNLLPSGESLHTPQQQPYNGPAHQIPQTNDHDNPQTLSYVIELIYRPECGSAEPLQVHHSIPASIADRPGLNVGQFQTPISLQEALTLPARGIVDQMIRTFFDKIHPAYPVLDREKFTSSYSRGQASPLVLQTIMLLGFTIGSDDLIRTAGFNDRATARKTHYLRAKALYDADYETDRMTLAAVLLLLGFWWAGPEDQKDTCYWVACASTLAQQLGMHRSTQISSNPRAEALRKRIWWTIYMRDRHTSAAFGRPCRIRDEDCDIEPLTDEDFSFDTGYDQSLVPAQTDYHISYVLEMSKLAVILGDILVGEFSPRRPPLEKFETESLANRLFQWESQLPNRLRIKASDGYQGASFWASMVQFSYQNTIILLFRPKSIEGRSPGDIERDTRARLAADSITRLAEDLLSTGMIDSALIHLYEKKPKLYRPTSAFSGFLISIARVPALFSALSIHTIVICRKNPVHRQLAENKSRQCMLALSVIAKSWPVRIWISKSFVNLMKRLTGQDSTSNGSIVNVSSSISTAPHNMASSPGEPSVPGLGNAIPPAMEDQYRSGVESSSACTCAGGLQPGGFHAYGCLWKAPDQFVHDALWAEYLDKAFEVDLLLHDSGISTQYVPGEPTTPNV